MRWISSVEHVARRAIAGNAVAHHAAEFGARLEYRAGMALAAQVIGAGEAGDAAADEGHALARRFARRRQFQSVLEGVMADEVFDRVDADEVVDLVAIAAVLARRRADEPHEHGKRIGFDHALEGVFLPLHARDRRLVHAARDRQPAANVVARGTGGLTRRGALDVGRALVGVIALEDLLRQVLVSHVDSPFLKRRKVGACVRTVSFIVASPHASCKADFCFASNSSACVEPVRTMAFDTI